jgi:glycogen(starch) synthase
MNNTFLFETAWEVCNQVGGIYTVIRSKAPFLANDWGENFCMIGPYFHDQIPSEFEPCEPPQNPIGATIGYMQEIGFEVHYGTWLVTGRPKCILINPITKGTDLSKIKSHYRVHYKIPSETHERLVDDVFLFANSVSLFFVKLAEENKKSKNALGKNLIAHFHEWMVGLPILDIANLPNKPIKTVFTTHATLLGRYIAGSNRNLYDELNFINWETVAREFNIMPQVSIEREAAQNATVFTTVSEVTAMECRSLLGRKPEVITPNGLNIDRFAALHKLENRHKRFKDTINQFLVGHFFHAYPFSLENTIYFFTSGRYEFKNKGFDMCMDALKLLNDKLKADNADVNVVMFFVTKAKYHTFNPVALQQRALMQEVKTTCDEITAKIGERLFESVTSSGKTTLPDLNTFVPDYWRLRLRRTLQAWKSDNLPLVVTHNLVDDQNDELLRSIRERKLFNYPEDKVKIIYHPDFISTTNPLFGLDYSQFITGCNLGIFPSYYEPWGYTPHECAVSGIPSVTSDLSGFGQYALANIPDRNEKGIFVIRRKDNSYEHSVKQLTNIMYEFCQQPRRERVLQRSQLQSVAPWFDWQTLIENYQKAYKLAIGANV